MNNTNNENIECSIFIPKGVKKYPCIVYLHGNSGSRLDGLKLVNKFLPHKIAVMCFDFAGAGISDGEYLTLGLKESHDLCIILAELKKRYRPISKIVLWGRSMGAVTALLYAGKFQSNETGKYKSKVCGIIADSPFSDLKKLSFEII